MRLAFATGSRGGLGESVVTDCDLLEVDLLLAIDGLLLADQHVLELEDTGLLQGTAGELLALGVLRAETQVDALDDGIGALADGDFDLGRALTLDG